MLRSSIFTRLSWLAGAVLALGAGAAQAQSPAAPAALSPEAEAPAVSFKDSRGAAVTVRVPAALHRPANRFRLYGWRPLTLHSRERRRDLYRDAFLELATRSTLHPRANAWDSLVKQLEWLGGGPAKPGAAEPAPPAVIPGLGLPAGVSGALDGITARLKGMPGHSHVVAVTRALQDGIPGVGGEDAVKLIAEPVAASLQLRALATDEAEQRLLRLGAALKLDAPGTDPAMRDGYHLARAEFEEVRRGLWPTISQAVRKNQGRLVLSAIKNVALSKLGFWAVFGYLGWQGAEGVLNTEYRGQYAVCLATLAHALDQERLRSPAARAELEPLALYAAYMRDYQLTETFRDGQLMELKPAGGRTASEWRLRLGTRSDELKRSLTAAPPPVGAAAPAGTEGASAR
ncbi:MAG: hypothetical protein ACK47B_02260 [Armatimonadota bacterium]